MPIKYNYEVSVNDNKAKLNKDIFLFRGNRNIHYYFSIKGARFTFSKENEDLLESSNAIYAAVTVVKPNGVEVANAIAPVEDGLIHLKVTEDLIDEEVEVGDFDLVFDLFDDNEGAVTIPKIKGQFHVQERPCTTSIGTLSGNVNVVNQAVVDLAIATQENEQLIVVDDDGKYVKTTWVKGDKISIERLNKIEEGIEKNSTQYKDIANLSLALGKDGLLYIKKQDGTLIGTGVKVNNDTDLSKVTMQINGNTLILLNNGTQIASVDLPNNMSATDVSNLIKKGVSETNYNALDTTDKRIIGGINEINIHLNSTAKKTIVEGNKIYLAKSDGTKLDTGTILPTGGTGKPYDDTSIKSDISNIKNDLGTAQLTTTAQNVKGAINEIDAKCDDIAVKTITTEERNKLNSLKNYDDTSIKTDINNIKTNLGTAQLTTTAKDVKGAINEVNKKIGTGVAYDDTAIKSDINTIKTNLGTDKLNTTAKDLKGAVNELNTQYKDIASRTITTEERNKLNSLNNYDDTSIKNDIQTINTQLGDIANELGDETLQTNAQDLKGAINEVFQNASNGKTLIAQAITGKGVSTSNTDTFQTMATNINSIQTVSDASGIIFTLNNKKYKLSKNDKGEYIATLLAYSVTSNLTHCTLDNTNTSIDYGNKYTCNISVNKGFIIDSVVITMGGTDVTSTVLKGNIITINSVTGDVIITVNCVEEPANPVYGNIKATPNYTFKINEIKGKLDPDLQVSLATAPNLNQTITITNNTPEYITISPNTLTFTPDNYSVPQKVSISPIRKNNDYLDRRGELVLSSKGVTDYTAKCTIINTDNYIHPSNCTLSDKVLDIHAYGLNSVPTTLESSVNNISCAVTPISNEGDDNVSKATANGLQYVTIDVPSLKPYLNESKGITAIYVSMGYPFVDKNLNSYLNLLGINSTKMNNSSYLFGYTKKPSTKGYEALNSYFYTSFNEKTTSADLHFNVFMFNPSDAPVGITYMIDDTNYTSIGSTGWFDYGKDLTSKISSYKNVSKESNTTFVAYQVYNGILSLDDINTIKNGILENLVPSEVTNTIDNMTVNVGDTILSTATVLPTALEPMCTKSITLKDDKLIKNKNEVIAKSEGQSSFTTTISKPLTGGKTYDYNFDTRVTIAPSYIKDLTVTKAEEGVVISNPISELTVGQEYLLIGTTLPPRFDEENIVYYESSNIEVARVRYGLVEALKEGSCTITAYNHDKTYSYQMPLTIKPKKERIFTNIKTINPSDYSFSATDYEGNYRLMKQIIEEDSAGYDKVVFPKGSVFKLKMPLGTTYNEDGSVNSYQAESSIIPNSNTVYDFNNSRIEMQFSEYLSLDSVYKDGIKVTRGYNLFNFTTKDNPESSIGQYQTVLEDSEIRNLTIVGERQLFPEQYNDSDGGWQIRYVNFATCKRCGIVNCDIGWCTGFNIGSVHGQQSWSPIIQGSHIEWGAINYETGEDDTTTYTDRVRIKKANICQLHKRVINKYTNDNSYSVGIWAGYLGYDYMGARFYDIFFYKHDEATDTYEYLGCHKYEYLYGIYEFPKDATHCRLVFYQKRLPPSGGLNYLGGGIMMITHLPTSVDCYIENCYIHDNYASGFACCGGQRFLVKNCKFERNYGRDGLGCHVDFEDGREGANCCIVSNCTFDDNYYGFIMPSGLYEVLHDNEFNGCGVKTTTESILMFNNIHKNTHFTRQEIGEAIVANSIFSNVTMNEVARSDWEKDYKWKMHMINNHMI